MYAYVIQHTLTRRLFPINESITYWDPQRESKNPPRLYKSAGMAWNAIRHASPENDYMLVPVRVKIEVAE